MAKTSDPGRAKAARGPRPENSSPGRAISRSTGQAGQDSKPSYGPGGKPLTLYVATNGAWSKIGIALDHTKRNLGRGARFVKTWEVVFARDVERRVKRKFRYDRYAGHEYFRVSPRRVIAEAERLIGQYERMQELDY